MPQVPVTPEMLDGDLHVVGLTDVGQVIQVDYADGCPDTYTSSEALVRWGLHNLREEEVTRLLSLSDIRPVDRAFLECWKPGLKRYEGLAIAASLGIQF